MYGKFEASDVEDRKTEVFLPVLKTPTPTITRPRDKENRGSGSGGGTCSSRAMESVSLSYSQVEEKKSVKCVNKVKRVLIGVNKATYTN